MDDQMLFPPHGHQTGSQDPGAWSHMNLSQQNVEGGGMLKTFPMYSSSVPSNASQWDPMLMQGGWGGTPQKPLDLDFPGMNAGGLQDTMMGSSGHMSSQDMQRQIRSRSSRAMMQKIQGLERYCLQLERHLKRINEYWLKEWDARMRAEQIALDIARSVARSDQRQAQVPSPTAQQHFAQSNDHLDGSGGYAQGSAAQHASAVGGQSIMAGEGFSLAGGLTNFQGTMSAGSGSEFSDVQSGGSMPHGFAPMLAHQARHAMGLHASSPQPGMGGKGSLCSQSSDLPSPRQQASWG